MHNEPFCISRSYLLHHKQHQTDKSKTIAQIFQYDCTSNEVEIGGLSNSYTAYTAIRTLKLAHKNINDRFNPRPAIK